MKQDREVDIKTDGLGKDTAVLSLRSGCREASDSKWLGLLSLDAF